MIDKDWKVDKALENAKKPKRMRFDRCIIKKGETAMRTK